MADKKADAAKSNQLSKQISNQLSELDADSVQSDRRPSVEAPVNQCVHAFMSSPVRTVQADAALADAQAILLRYGHTCLCVVDQREQLVGILSRRDVDVALRHGLQAAQVLTCMSAPVRVIASHASLSEAHRLMVTYDIGRLPVIRSDQHLNGLVGIITRSDVLRQLQVIPPPAPTETPVPSQLWQQLKVRSGPLWTPLDLLIKAAEEKGWALYAVGGAVRDLLLSHMGQSYPLIDIDLVVDGAQADAGAVLASLVSSSYPQFELKVYGDFQTATLTCLLPDTEPPDTDDIQDGASGLEIDIATARTEFYPYPAANPEVEVSTIHQDLYRRDFTINAMALCLTGSVRGRLLDFFGGWLDLQQRHIRVIHPNSFIEDPTRIFRALRFATRLGFELDPYTQRLVGYAVRSSLYAQARAQHQKVPALQSRLTAELEKVLSANDWLTSLKAVSQLGALSCLHPNLLLTSELCLQLCRIARWQHRFLPETPRWRLLLVILLSQLLPDERSQVAKTLNLDTQSRYQLENLHQWERELTDQLPSANKPSEIYQCLNSYSRVEQLLIVSRNPYTLGPQIWHHIIHLSRMPSLINGDTLKRLGYPPGPKYREILTAIHQLTLDGAIDSAKAAESYVMAHYPQKEIS